MTAISLLSLLVTAIVWRSSFAFTPLLPPHRCGRSSPFCSASDASIATADLYLGIDCGTQGTKALVYNADTKKVVAVSGISTPLLPVREPMPSEGLVRAEQDPQQWVEALVQSCIAVLDEADAKFEGTGQCARRCVRGIGVSGQQHGMVVMDEHYKVLRPAKLWCDTESAPEAAELRSRDPKRHGHIVAGFTCSKLLWLKRHEPHVFAQMRHLALPHDYLNLVLTGTLVMECGDASGTGLLDHERRRWDAEAAAAVDDSLLEKLPPLIGTADLVGDGLQPSLASLLGLPAGLPVSAGGGDNMMSALGSGCTVTGRVAMSLGTSGTIFAKTAPLQTAAAAAATTADGDDEYDSSKSAGNVGSSRDQICPFLDATGGGLPLLCTLNCASVPEEVRIGYGLERGEIEAMAAREPVGCEGLTFLPYLNGERSPNWPHASGALVGIRPGHLARPGLVYRAALEGVAFSLRAGLREMRAHGVGATLSAVSGSDSSAAARETGALELRLVGGGSKNKLWRRIIADALACPVTIPSQPESAALGAALQAAAAVALRHRREPEEEAIGIGEWIHRHHDAPVDGDLIIPDTSTAAAYAQAFRLYEERALGLFGGGEVQSPASS